MQDRLGHTAFGLIAACSALAVVVATVADLGLTQFTVQRLAAEPGFSDSQFPTLLPMRGLLTLLALLALLGVGWGLGYRGSQLYLLAAVGAGLLLTQYGQFLRAPVQARQHFNTDAVLSVLEKLLALGLVVGLLLGGQLGLSSYVGARLAAAAFTAVLFMGLLRRLFGRLPHRWPAGGQRGSCCAAACHLLLSPCSTASMSASIWCCWKDFPRRAKPATMPALTAGSMPL
ncbi:oligosaccharide flippase family protein [Hymenobacter sp. BRD67]|uniref:oligosaccharide flippase family protein n=1 Tax=Hymenobacter sp. BRD67 TaxID=2675877 RepID=UPI001564392C|nr:oligosaccharide flippase family protein [Hymenobacter sp. BRD67]QKG52955.1 oligosaccharide flippase family protein [Hymenobacter sp. BRD67]